MKFVRPKRLLVWGGIPLVLVVLAAIFLVPKPVPADLATVTRGPLRVTLDHEGKTRIRNRFVISAPVAGRVRRVELEPGDPVVAHKTLLATFDPQSASLLDARSRAEAEAAARAAQASLSGARAELKRAVAESDLAEADLQRTRSLESQSVASRQALDAAEARARSAAEGVQAAQAKVAQTTHELEQARARAESPEAPRRGQGSLPVIELRSPVDGVVLQRYRQSAAVVPMGEPLLEVADPADLEVIADFLSTDAVQMRPGMPVIIDRWGGGVDLRGRVKRVEPAGFTKISALGVEEQRVYVVVSFEDPRTAWKALGDDFRVEVRVVVWEGSNVLQVPTSSLLRDGARWAVFAVVGGRARRRPVEIGHRTGLEAEVVAGLEQGQTVIAHPSDAVVEGARVRQRE